MIVSDIKDKKKFWNLFIISLFILLISIILFFGSYIYEYEIKEAKSFCESKNLTYKWKFLNFCDNKTIYKYHNTLNNEKFWEFEDIMKQQESNLGYLKNNLFLGNLTLNLK